MMNVTWCPVEKKLRGWITGLRQKNIAWGLVQIYWFLWSSIGQKQKKMTAVRSQVGSGNQVGT